MLHFHIHFHRVVVINLQIPMVAEGAAMILSALMIIMELELNSISIAPRLPRFTD
jgi:hypothetical protein